MSVKDTFLKITGFLGFFNFVLYIANIGNLLSISSIITTFVSLGAIAVAVSLIPLIHASDTMRWFMSTAIVVALLYSISFSFLTWNITIGLGLVTNITNLFNSNPNQIGFLPWIFFQFIGFIVLLAGIYGLGSGD